MDILSTALLNLGVIGKSERARREMDLCATLKELVKLKLIASSAVNCCRGIESLIQVSDYDISDFDAFEEEVSAEIESLQAELENTFEILEKRIANDADG